MIATAAYISQSAVHPGNAHNPGLSCTPAIGGGSAGMIATAFREERETGLFGGLVVLSAAGEVRLIGQPGEGAA